METKLKQYEKYVTVTEGMDYRTISKELAKIGVNLKHATVRNITEKTMPVFLENFIENAGFGGVWAAPIASLMMEKYLTKKVKRTDLEKRMIEANLMNLR